MNSAAAETFRFRVIECGRTCFLTWDPPHAHLSNDSNQNKQPVSMIINAGLRMRKHLRRQSAGL